MTNDITTFTTEHRIVATSGTAALTVPDSVVAETSREDLQTLVHSLCRALLATPTAEAVTVTLDGRDVQLSAGNEFGTTAVAALTDRLDALVDAILDVHWALDAGGPTPDHLADQPMRADGGNR